MSMRQNNVTIAIATMYPASTFEFEHMYGKAVGISVDEYIGGKVCISDHWTHNRVRK